MADDTAPASPPVPALSTQAATGQRFEDLWAEVKQLLEWREGFAFYLLIGGDPRVADRLRERVNDFAVTRTQVLQLLRPEQPEGLVQQVLRAVLPATDSPDAHYARLRAPLWLDLSMAPGHPEWDSARRKALAQLNRYRSLLERDCLRPLFLHLPLALAPEVVTWAPDLWSIRGAVLVLPQEEESTSAMTVKELRALSVKLTEVGDAERDRGHLEAALNAYRESLALDRQLRDRVGDTPQVLRDLSVSLNKVGQAEGDSGRPQAALEAYRESLGLSRQLRAVLGDTPQVLRDLSISLDKVGQAEGDSGRPQAALDAYRESLELSRQLRTVLGDTPQVLRDLSISLNNVGQAESDSGRPQAALEAYRESLELRRQLRTVLGDTWRVLTDLAVVLPRVVKLARSLGHEPEALAAEAELQEIQALLQKAEAATPHPPVPE